MGRKKVIKGKVGIPTNGQSIMQKWNSINNARIDAACKEIENTLNKYEVTGEEFDKLIRVKITNETP